MNQPEFRCLICDKVLAESTDTALPREACAQCGKFTVPGLAASELPMAELVPVVQPRELTAKPQPIPEVLPRAKVLPPTVPTVQRMQAEMFRPDDVPDAERPKPKLAFALFVTFLTMLAIAACLIVVAYTIVLGLKKAGKRVEAAPTVRVATVPSAGR